MLGNVAAQKTQAACCLDETSGESVEQAINLSQRLQQDKPRAAICSHQPLGANSIFFFSFLTSCLAEANRGQFTPKIGGRRKKTNPSFLVRRFFTVLDWFGLSRRRLCFHSRVIEADTSRLRQDSPPDWMRELSFSLHLHRQTDRVHRLQQDPCS